MDKFGRWLLSGGETFSDVYNSFLTTDIDENNPLALINSMVSRHCHNGSGGTGPWSATWQDVCNVGEAVVNE